MARARNFLQALIGIALLLGLTIVLIGLFSSARGSQTTSEPQPASVPTPATETAATAGVESTLARVTATLTLEPKPTLGPRPTGILFESAGQLH
ncbi:MAG: hypothetical protein ACRDGG_03050, partial [Anaerolineae bacterium]